MKSYNHFENVPLMIIYIWTKKKVTTEWNAEKEKKIILVSLNTEIFNQIFFFCLLNSDCRPPFPKYTKKKIFDDNLLRIIFEMMMMMKIWKQNKKKMDAEKKCKTLWVQADDVKTKWPETKKKLIQHTFW